MCNLEYREAKKLTKFRKTYRTVLLTQIMLLITNFQMFRTILQRKKHPQLNIPFGFIYETQTFGVWSDFKLGKIYISKDFVKDCPFLFSTTLENHTPNTLFLQSARKYNCWKNFIDQFMYGNVRYENQKIKAVVTSLIKSLVTS